MRSIIVCWMTFPLVIISVRMSIKIMKWVTYNWRCSWRWKCRPDQSAHSCSSIRTQSNQIEWWRCQHRYPSIIQFQFISLCLIAFILLHSKLFFLHIVFIWFCCVHLISLGVNNDELLIIVSHSFSNWDYSWFSCCDWIITRWHSFLYE